MSVMRECTAVCAETPECTVCGQQKRLRGRSYPAAMGGGGCDDDCPGYRQEPRAGHLWWNEWAAHERGDHSGCLDCGSTTVEARCYECGEPMGFVGSPPRLYRCNDCSDTATAGATDAGEVKP